MSNIGLVHELDSAVAELRSVGPEADPGLVAFLLNYLSEIRSDLTSGVEPDSDMATGLVRAVTDSMTFADGKVGQRLIRFADRLAEAAGDE